ncbi:MAG TPA: type III-B CRISPR module RAMP protein Cmr1 [Micromonosporaceae bacterium]
MTGSITWHPFTIRFVTPAFLGQDPGHVDGHSSAFPFPVASLRGALRYWLRALVGAHVGNNLEALRRVEEKVYGAAAGGDSGTPSRVLLRCRQPVRRANTTDNSWLGSPVSEDDISQIGYLLGPGIWNSKRPRAEHRAVAPDTRVQFAVRTAGETSAALFLASLWALRTFGGLGARVRRGFGTFQLVDVPQLGIDTPWLGRDNPEDLTAVLAMVREHVTRLTGVVEPDGARPSYPRFDTTGKSHKTRSVLLRRGRNSDTGPPATDAGSALAACGRLWQAHRAELSREDSIYSQIVKPFLDGGDPSSDEFTLGTYGLPVVYYDRVTRRSATVEPVVDGKSARRASPVWLRVRPGRAAWQLHTLVFLAEWLPTEARLRIKDRRRSRPVASPSADTVDEELGYWLDAVTAPISDAPSG